MTIPNARLRGALAVAAVVCLVAAMPVGARAGARGTTTRLTSANSTSSDFNGDGFADLAIGLPGENLAHGLADAGAVSVLYGSASGLQADAPDDQFWTASTAGGSAAAGDQFGSALAVGDFNGDGYADLAVGMPFDDVGDAVDAGSITVLYGSPSRLQVAPPNARSWWQGARGVPDAAEAGDHFGNAFAVGDFDGNGNPDLAIGASGETVGGSIGAGAVIVLFSTPSGLQTDEPGPGLWTENDVSMALAAGDAFGYALGAGDFDADGHADLAIGISYFDQSAKKRNSGAAVVLYGSASGPQVTSPPLQTWTENRPNVDESAESDDRLGSSLATGDLDGDGYDDLLIGVPWEDVWLEDGTNEVSGAGAFILIHGSSTGLQATTRKGEAWSQETPGVIGLAEHRDHFGFSIATGDMNGDGFSDVVAGVPQEDGGPESIRQSGATNVLYSDATGPTAITDWHLDQDSPDVADDAEPYDFFGAAVAAADFNGDGYADLAVGVPQEDGGGLTNPGAVHVLYGSPGGLQALSYDDMLWTQDSPGVRDSGQRGDLMGSALAAG
jgi:hypothetical protein